MSEFSPETRAFLDEARRAPGLPEAKRAALKSGVLGHVAAGTAPLAAGALGKGTLVIVMSLVVGAAVVAGGVAAWSRAPDAAPIIAPITSPTAPATPSPIAPTTSASLAQTAPTTSPSDAPLVEAPSLAAPEPALSAKTHAPRAKPSTASGASAPATKVDGRAAPAAPTVTETTPTATPTAPSTATPTAPGIVAPATTGMTPTPAKASSLEEETRLVRGAAAARKEGDPSRALALLDAHASRFPHGALERERRAERVFALCDARRAGEARAEAASLLRDNPRGALADRVRASCGAP